MRFALKILIFLLPLCALCILYVLRVQKRQTTTIPIRGKSGLYPSILEKSATPSRAERIPFKSFNLFSRKAASSALTVT